MEHVTQMTKLVTLSNFTYLPTPWSSVFLEKLALKHEEYCSYRPHKYHQRINLKHFF